jgi:hypothetical protein
MLLEGTELLLERKDKMNWVKYLSLTLSIVALLLAILFQILTEYHDKIGVSTHYPVSIMVCTSITLGLFETFYDTYLKCN